MRKVLYNVIDVSHHNGTIDFKKVKDSGIEGVIIKVGGSDGAKNYYKDKMFEQNYFNAKLNGLKVGAYWFSGTQINNMAIGVTDAKNFEKCIVGKEFELPIFMDYEVGNKLNKSGNTDAIIGFCNYLETKKYYVGVYGSEVNTFKEMVQAPRLKAYCKWVAKYSANEPSMADYGFWQYTSKGKVDGIKGNVDMSHCYIDYEKAIKRLKLNGFK